MKKILLALATLMVIVGVTAGEFGKEWYTDFDAAKAASVKEKKPIMMLFTGSDWCQYCLVFHKEVLSQKSFKDFAAKKLVLMLVDFPRKKAQDAKLKMANEILYKVYRCGGFPQTILVNADGKILKKFPAGYISGAANTFMKNLEKETKSFTK